MILLHPPSNPKSSQQRSQKHTSSINKVFDSHLVWKLRADLSSMVAPAGEDKSYPTAIALPVLASRKPPPTGVNVENLFFGGGVADY